MNNKQEIQSTPVLGDLRQGIWLLGTSFWVFGILDRSLASFSDGYLSAIDIVQLLTASFFFVSWLLLKPASQVPASQTKVSESSD
ncbi:MAG: hypothetical protein KME45_11390 [Stenomitos rutilans HA7619-LM2]|jgi:hypothetical protein|nr:hypothetical protein [Stenomitos rutilans HA7619-LM2]